MRTDKSSARRQGMTLIEVIVALGIAALVVAVIAVAHQALTRHASSQAEQLAKNDRVVNTTRELRTALQNLFPAESDSADCEILLENTPTRLVSLSFCRRVPPVVMTSEFSNRMERVSYMLGELRGRPALLKSGTALSGPAGLEPVVTNRVHPAWTDLRVELYDGETWRSEWPGPEEDQAAAVSPAAARIQFMPRDLNVTNPLHETVIVIPAGMTVERSVDDI